MRCRTGGSIRNRNTAGTCNSYRLPAKTHKPIASVAALTAQPLAALPPYGCGVPLAGCERLAGCRFGGTPPTAPALVGERHAAPGDALAVRTNRRQNGNSLRFVIARRPQADVAISGRQLRFRRKCPVIHPGSARLHPKGTSSRFALRAPRRPPASSQ